MKKTVYVRCYVSGHVQGVGFRYATAQKAAALGITGYARNLRDRRVEVLACGEEQAVATLQNWLRQGPPMARVDHIQCEPATCQKHDDFHIE